MKALVRKGDVNSRGGIALQGHSNVTCNGKQVAKYGSKVSPHPCCPKPGCNIHCAATAARPGSSTVTANGIRVLRMSMDIDSCGHSRAQGSPNVVTA